MIQNLHKSSFRRVKGHSGVKVSSGRDHRHYKIPWLLKLEELQKEELEGFKIYTRGHFSGLWGHSRVRGRSFTVKGRSDRAREGPVWLTRTIPDL